MPSSIQRTKILSQFSCLGDKCIDTCCQGWSMQVDEPTLRRYREEAPELLNATESGGLEATTIMRKNSGTGFCVKLEGGLCGIHKKYGDRFLSDACHFYPRVTRTLGKTVLMTASASCPEIARLAFTMKEGMDFEPAKTDRVPYGMKDYLPPELSSEEALATHQAFLDAVDDKTVSVERIVARMVSASHSMELLNKKDWPTAAAFYLKNADTRLPEPQRVPEDPFNLLLALAGLIVASHKIIGGRLKETIAEMEKSLAATIDWQHMIIITNEKSFSAWQRMHTQWQSTFAARYDTILRRWLLLQLSMALYPFAGLGATLSERMTIIGVRLATFKLALICASDSYGDALPEETVVRIAQSLARFLDHLGEANFSLKIYTETGWIKESRLRGLLEI